MRERRVAGLGSTVLEAVFPGTCLLCGQGLRGRCRPLFPVCEVCLRALVPIQDPQRCRVCSMPLISEAEICTRCRSRRHAFNRCFALFEYRGEVRELIYQYKFQDRRRVGRVLGYLLGRTYEKQFGRLPAVPVPGNTRGVRRRGWDPMRQVASVMAALFDIQVLDLLRRGASREQKGLSFDDRLANLQGAIRLRRPAPRVPEELVLIDDIFTTGATASECARLLQERGARKVEVFALAID